MDCTHRGSHTYTGAPLGGCCQASCCQAHWEQFSVVLKDTYRMWTVWAKTPTTDPSITGQTVSTEQQIIWILVTAGSLFGWFVKFFWQRNLFANSFTHCRPLKGSYTIYRNMELTRHPLKLQPPMLETSGTLRSKVSLWIAVNQSQIRNRNQTHFSTLCIAIYIRDDSAFFIKCTVR